ncbi:MAG: acyl-CoA dehydrogenase family protein [Gammaproteobacteria bacterium]|nr:acyl-CoA dehydrogenase family protein [Gammaproteobacteria bacterium]NNF61585.1 acyl-CoA dehydrogenase [Gammaproteobacteria bacterium]
MSFIQDAPRLGNQFTGDPLLQRWLRWRLPDHAFGEIVEGLHALGGRVVGDIAQYAADAEANPPQLRHFDAWGNRADTIVMADGWQKLHAAAATEGIIATAYEQSQGEYSRAHQFARLYLFHPSSALYSCPLAMTDGAASVLLQLGSRQLAQRVVRRLTSRVPEEFWTSGQWMTETAGGSDVSNTGTVAHPDGDGYRLAGHKWFSSAATSEIALTLAQLDGRLSLFYLETRNKDGSLNGITIERLKDKLGTRAMPTAELALQGTRARLLGEPGHGVRNIAGMLNITRLYNSVCAVASMRRGLALARDYAHRRTAFGRPLIGHVLHRETLANLEAHYQSAFHLVFHLGLLLGKAEAGVASDAEQLLLRLMTPVTKLYTARLAVASASEVLECFGGAGYIEDTGLPKLLRDAQVLPIWEGTTNVLSLDASRVLQRQPAAMEAFVSDVYGRLAGDDRELAPARRHINDGMGRLRVLPADSEADARELAFGLARVYAASLMYECVAAHPAWQVSRAALEWTVQRTLVGPWAQPGTLAAADILARQR